MAPRGCLLLPLIFIASTRVIFVGAQCGAEPANPCDDPVNEANVCAGCPAGEFSPVPNPLDCGSYFVCKDGSSFLAPDPIICPDGEVFNLTALDCALDDGTCTTYCPESSGGACSYTCGAVDEKIADHFDCHTYYTCEESDPSVFVPGPAQTCSDPKPFFSGECGTDETACCHCKPFCYDTDAMGTYVEDPTDCRKYFICTAPGEVPTFNSVCPANEHFDLHAQECSSTAPCVTLCRNVMDENSCIDPFTCQETGIFPVCKTKCIENYYRCTVVSDDYASPETCPNGLLFNPDTLTCVSEDVCPYDGM